MLQFQYINPQIRYVFYLPELQLFANHNMGGWQLNDILIYTEPSQHDGPSDDHRFRTLHCNGVTDIHKALSIGNELISLVRGFYAITNSQIKSENINLIEVKDLHGHVKLYNDSEEGYTKLYEEIGESLRTKLTPYEYKQYKSNTLINLINSSLYLAQKPKNIGLYLILKYFSMPLTWAILYKIMETLETIESHHDKKWSVTYTRADRTKFTNPANNFSLLQIDARHGLKPDSLRPNSTNRMTLDEAKLMFKRCAYSYLKYKFEEHKYLALLEKVSVTYFIRHKSQIDLKISNINVYKKI